MIWTDAPYKVWYGYSCIFCWTIWLHCWSQRPSGLRWGSVTALLLVLWVWIPPGTWMSVFCECCALLGRGSCDGLITRPEESYQLWCITVCNLRISRMRQLWSTMGCCTGGRGVWNGCNFFNNFSLVFLYLWKILAHWAFIILTLFIPCILNWCCV